MDPKPGLATLPNELLLSTVANLDNGNDISSACAVNRRFAWLFVDVLIQFGITRRLNSGRDFEQSYSELFFHAVRTDSAKLVEFITLRVPTFDLKGMVPLGLFETNKITFLHHSLVGDAPRVAAHLMKHGADIHQDEGGLYPDLTPLYFTLARAQTSSAAELDRALRIACMFGLPRTVRWLLVRGADPNTRTAYGLSAMHNALMRRAPWSDSPKFRFLMSEAKCWINFIDPSYDWNRMVRNTVYALEEFGADVYALTETSRRHSKCDHRCWKSLDCDPRGQTHLHLAAAGGFLDAVLLLLAKGLDPDVASEEGYTPIFTAIAQGHKEVACLLMARSPTNKTTRNPIVHLPSRATALHVACRFAFPEMVEAILQRGVNPNVMDWDGVTPIHEALKQTRLDREKEVVKTLRHLADFGADPEMCVSDTIKTTRCIWQTASSHPFIGVREMFGDYMLSIFDEEDRRHEENIPTQTIRHPDDWWGCEPEQTLLETLEAPETHGGPPKAHPSPANGLESAPRKKHWPRKNKISRIQNEENSQPSLALNNPPITPWPTNKTTQKIAELVEGLKETGTEDTAHSRSKGATTTTRRRNATALKSLKKTQDPMSTMPPETITTATPGGPSKSIPNQVNKAVLPGPAPVITTAPPTWGNLPEQGAQMLKGAPESTTKNKNAAETIEQQGKKKTGGGRGKKQWSPLAL